MSKLSFWTKSRLRFRQKYDINNIATILSFSITVELFLKFQKEFFINTIAFVFVQFFYFSFHSLILMFWDIPVICLAAPVFN